MSNMDDPFDPAALRINPADIPAVKPRGTARRRLRKFVMFPELWREQLADIRAHGSTYRVAIFLLGEAWRTNNRAVKLTNVALTQAGVKRDGKAIALQELRQAGLVAVEQSPRKSPIVTVRFTES